MSASNAYPDWALAIVRPGDHRPSPDHCMRDALALARASLVHTGGGPFATVIATDDGEVVALGWNAVVPTHDPTAHGEVQAIRRAGTALQRFRLQAEAGPRLTLYTTCAPCLMCTGAIHWSGVTRVVASALAADAEALGFREGPRAFEAGQVLAECGVEYRAGLLRDQGIALLQSYTGPIYNGREVRR